MSRRLVKSLLVQDLHEFFFYYHTEGLRLPSSTAHIEGPPFHRGASASKEEGASGPQSAIWPS